MKILKFFLYLLLISLLACNTNNNVDSSIDLSEYEDSLSYCVGINIGQKLKQEGITEIDMELMKVAIEQVLSEDTLAVSYDKSQELLYKYFLLKKKKKDKITKTDNKEFLKENRNKSGIVETHSGLQYRIIKDAYGSTPTMEDEVVLNYRLKNIEGAVIDQTFDKLPVTVPLNRTILAWQETLMMMSEGAIYEIYVKPQLAFGEKFHDHKIEKNMLLVYEIQLIKIITNNLNNNELWH